MLVSSQLLMVASDFSHFLAQSYIITMFLSPHGLLPSASLCPNLPFLSCTKIPIISFRIYPNLASDHLNLITSAKIKLSNKVTLTYTRDQGLNYLLGKWGAWTPFNSLQYMISQILYTLILVYCYLVILKKISIRVNLS